MTGHPIVHLELAAQDPKAAGRFYSELFGWSLQHDQQFDYLQFQGDGGPGGAFVKAGEQGNQPREVLVYVGTDDIDGTLRRAEELGGKTLTPKMEIPGIGWMGIFADPDGRRVGLFTGGPGTQG